MRSGPGWMVQIQEGNEQATQNKLSKQAAREAGVTRARGGRGTEAGTAGVTIGQQVRRLGGALPSIARRTASSHPAAPGTGESN